MLISGTTGIDLTGLPINNSGNAEVEGNLNLSATSVVQPNITNTNMVFKVRPSGSATYAALVGYNSSDISNTHFGQIAVRNDAVTIDSSKTGTGTFKPLKLGVGGSYPIVIDTGNNLSLGSGFQGVGALLPDNGEMTVKPVSTGGGVRISAVASDYSSLPSWMSTSLGQYGSAASGDYITGIPKANLGMLWGQNITNMIIGSNSSSPLVFVNSSTEKMRIDTNGNVGIGDISPAFKLSLGQSAVLPSTAGGKITSFSKYTNVGNASFLRFDTVRTSAGSSHTSSEERIRKVVDATEMGYVGFGDNNVFFGNAGGKLATLNTYGFAVDTGAYTLNSYWSNSSKSAGTDWGHFYGTSNNNTIANIIIYGNGNIVNANNSYGALSDIKLKENIIDVSPKLDKLMKVRVVNYNLIGQEQKQIGVIAQEIEQIFPGLIDETKDTKQVEIEKERLVPALDEIVDNDGNVVQEAKPEYIEKYMDIETIETGETTKSVKYSVLYMMMLKGMQEQQEIISDLRARIEVLEGGN